MPRPNHYDQYADIPEIVPGVFVSPGECVHIVDDQGEVVSWTGDEWDADPESVTATINAVILAAKFGPAAVRRNIADKGQTIENLIRETALLNK